MHNRTAAGHQTMNLLINLGRSPDRLQSATACLEAAGIAFERIDEVDGTLSDLTRHPDYDADQARKRYGRDLTSNEIGCYLSHRKCVETFVRSDAEYALVMEDDLTMPLDFSTVFNDAIDWLARHYKGRWDMLNVGAKARKVFTPLETLHFSGGETTICAAHFFPLLATGIVWSKEGAARFLRDGRPIAAPVDQFFRDWCIASDRGLAFDRPLISTTGVSSTIGYAHLAVQKRQNRSIAAAVVKSLGHQRRKLAARRNKARFKPLG